MKRTMTLVLALLLLLASCGGGTETETTAETAVQTEAAAVETELTDNLPERDYGGADYVILAAAEQWQNTYAAEESTGDVLNDAVFHRNTAVEERFGVGLQYEVVNGYTAGTAIVTDKLRGSVQAGDAVYDLMTASSAYTAPYITGGLLQNMTKMEYLDFDAPWYFHETNANLTVDGKLYIAAGSFGFNTIDQCGALFFNKELMVDLGEEYPYQTVLDGKWTYDKMLVLCEKAAMDLDGDGASTGADRFGLLSTQDESLQWLAYGMGYLITKPDAEGFPAFVGATEQSVDILDLLSLLKSNKTAYYSCAINPPDEMIPMFAAGQTLFAAYCLKLAPYEEMRNAPDFGILPMPKLDESQKMYYSKAFVDVAAFPMVLKDAEMSQIVLEGLQSSSHFDVLPAYYDVVLQRKLTRDEDSAAMIDLIREGIICDFGMAFFSVLSAELFQIEPLIRNGSFSTWWAGQEKGLNTKLDGLLETLATLDTEG